MINLLRYIYHDFRIFGFNIFYKILFDLVGVNQKKIDNLKAGPLEIRIFDKLLNIGELFIEYNKQIVYYLFLPLIIALLMGPKLLDGLIFYSYVLQFFYDYYIYLLKRLYQFFVIKNGVEIIFYLEKVRFTLMEMEFEDISPSYNEAMGIKDWDVRLLEKREALYNRTPPYSGGAKIYLFKYNKPADGTYYTDSYFPIPWNKIKAKALAYAGEKGGKRNYHYGLDEIYVERAKIYNNLIFKRRIFKLMNLPMKKPPANSFIVKEYEFNCGYFINNKYVSSHYNTIIESMFLNSFLPKSWFSEKVSYELAPEVLLTLKTATKGNLVDCTIKTNNDIDFYNFLQNKYGGTRRLSFDEYTNFFDFNLYKLDRVGCKKGLVARLLNFSLFIETGEHVADYKPFGEPYREALDAAFLRNFDIKLGKMNRLVIDVNKMPRLPDFVPKDYDIEAWGQQCDVFLKELFTLPTNDPMIPIIKKGIHGNLKLEYHFSDGITVDYTKNIFRRFCICLRDNLLYQNSLMMLSGLGRNSNEDTLKYLFTFQDVLLNLYRLDIITYDTLVQTYKENWHFANTLEFYKQIQKDIINYFTINDYSPKDRAKFDIFFSFKVPQCDFTGNNNKCVMIFYREPGAPEYGVGGHEKCKIFVMDYKGGYDIVVNPTNKPTGTSFWLYLRRGFHPGGYPVMNNIAHYSLGRSHPIMPTEFYHTQGYPYFDLFNNIDPDSNLFKSTYSIEKLLTYEKHELEYKVYQKRLANQRQFVVELASYIKNCFINSYLYC